MLGGLRWVGSDGGGREKIERTEYVGDCGGTAKRGMRSGGERVRASTSARGVVRGCGGRE